MKSIHSPYSTQSNYYYLFLHALFITNQKNPKTNKQLNESKDKCPRGRSIYNQN